MPRVVTDRVLAFLIEELISQIQWLYDDPWAHEDPIARYQELRLVCDELEVDFAASLALVSSKHEIARFERLLEDAAQSPQSYRKEVESYDTDLWQLVSPDGTPLGFDTTDPVVRFSSVSRR